MKLDRKLKVEIPQEYLVHIELALIDKIDKLERKKKRNNIGIPQELINKNIEILKFIELKLPIYNPNKK